MIVTDRVFNCTTKTWSLVEREVPDDVANIPEPVEPPYVEPDPTEAERIAALEDELAAAKIVLGVE